jgi:hypothetical protein
MAYAIFFFAVTAVVCLGLWFFPRSVAGKLLPEPAGHAPAVSSPDTWLAMGCALIGLWMLTYAVPALARDAVVLQLATDYYQDTSQTRSWVFYNLLEVVIAFWLVFGAAGFRRLFWWARSAGIGGSSN